MNFRYDIGFLRAVAVIIVCLYHFNVPFFSGGFVGVDIFFVISGFLMTGIIYKGIDSKSFSFKDFYIKRAKRIIPALLFIGIFICLLSSILFYEAEIKQNGKNVFLGITFVSNIYYWLYTDYFNPASHNNIFLHSWSLSVEWQFYVLYPVLIYSIKSYIKNRYRLGIILGILTIASFLLCVLISKDYNNFTFYMLPTRAWEMTLGGLAFVYSEKMRKYLFQFKNILTFIAILLIVFSFISFNNATLWPSSLTLIPTLSTFIIIALHSDFKFYQNKIVQFFGNISYSLYLWHWPIFVIFSYFVRIQTLHIILMSILSLVMASISYFLIEKNEKLSNIKTVIIVLPLISGLCMLFYFKPYNPVTDNLRIFSNDYKQIADFYYDKKEQFFSRGCYLTDLTEYGEYDYNSCLTVSNDKENIVLIGDSHSAQFSNSFRKMANDNQNILELSASFTFPFPQSKGYVESSKLMTYFYNNFLPENYDKIDKVFISVHWYNRARKEINYSDNEMKSEIIRIIEVFSNYNIDYYFIGQSESYIVDYPRIALLEKIRNVDCKDEFLDTESYKVNEFLKTFIPEDRYIDIFNLKNVHHQEKNMLYMSDKNHYTQFGSDQIVRYIKSKQYF